MITNSQISFVSRSCVFAATLLFTAAISTNVGAVQDVMLQTMSAKIVTGIVDDASGAGTLGTRVYRGQFLSNFLASNPGFFGLRTGDVNIPPGAEGFPSNHDVNFDLLSMQIGVASSNLFYWSGNDINGGGLDLSDVNFVAPTEITWSVLDDDSNWYAVSGTDQFVPGGVIDRTSADVWPDGIDSGSIHSHLALQLSDNDGNSGTSPPAGIYLISWGARSVGFTNSDPFFFVFRTSTVANSVRDLAAQWVEQHLMASGDYNGDGIVNAADYVLWRKGGPLQNEVATLNSVTAEDYTEWRMRFGNIGIATGGGLALGQFVPEPATGAGVAVTLVGIIVGHKSRRG